MSFKVDLHTHTSDFSHLLITNVDKKVYTLKLLQRLFKKGNNLVIGIAEFNCDGRFGKFVDATKELPKNYVVDQKNSDWMISIKKNKKKIYFVRTDEVETNKGHILIVGNKEKIDVHNLENLLKIAKKKKWVVVADHPLHKASLAYFLIAKIFSLKNLSLDEKTIKKYKDYFSSIEMNSYFPEDWKKIKKFAKKNKIPIIADSDAHFVNEFFQSHFDVKYLNFKSLSKFTKSLKKALKKHVKTHSQKHIFTAKYKHGFDSIIFEFILGKMGLIKK